MGRTYCNDTDQLLQKLDIKLEKVLHTNSNATTEKNSQLCS